MALFDFFNIRGHASKYYYAKYIEDREQLFVTCFLSYDKLYGKKINQRLKTSMFIYKDDHFGRALLVHSVSQSWVSEYEGVKGSVVLTFLLNFFILRHISRFCNLHKRKTKNGL